MTLQQSANAHQSRLCPRCSQLTHRSRSCAGSGQPSRIRSTLTSWTDFSKMPRKHLFHGLGKNLYPTSLAKPDAGSQRSAATCKRKAQGTNSWQGGPLSATRLSSGRSASLDGELPSHPGYSAFSQTSLGLQKASAAAASAARCRAAASAAPRQWRRSRLGISSRSSYGWQSKLWSLFGYP